MKNILLISLILGSILSATLFITGCPDAGEEEYQGPGIPYDGEIIPAVRRIDWDPGIPGGIPARTTIFASVTDYGAVGNGSTDDTQAIQAAIDACPEGQVVYIPAGDYRLTGELSVTKGIVLRGAGPENTFLRFYRTGNPNRNIYLGSPGYLGTDTADVVSGYTKGSTSMTLASAADISTGDFLYITQDNDGDFVTNVGYGGTCSWCGDSGRGLGQCLVVQSVSGNTITFEPPLYWSYTSSLHPYVNEYENVVHYAGLEDLYVDNVNEASTISIRLQGCVNCWLQNIESNNGQRHIEMDFTYRSEVRDSYIHHHHVYESEHYSVLLGSFSTANLIENNIFYHTMGGTMMAAWGSAGNVVAYNYSNYVLYTGTNYLQPDVMHHGAHPMMNLWEGNSGQMLSSDSYWGSISHTTFFRNDVRRELGVESIALYNKYAVILEKDCIHFNIVGNILGFSGMDNDIYILEGQSTSGNNSGIYKFGYESFGDSDAAGNDPEVKETTLMHGNFDYMTNSTVWDENISDHDLPDSLYLTAKPDFFGATPWPPIGPDVAGYRNPLPAQIRFESMRK